MFSPAIRMELQEDLVVETLDLLNAPEEMPQYDEISQETEPRTPPQVQDAGQTVVQIHYSERIQTETEDNPGPEIEQNETLRSKRAAEEEEESWFQQPGWKKDNSKRSRRDVEATPGSSKAARYPIGGKNLAALRKSIRSPLPSPLPSPARSPEASQSVVGASQDEEDADILEDLRTERQRREEEDRRRRQWELQTAARGAAIRNNIKKKTALLSEVKWEEKALRKQREALRQQRLALDAAERCLEEKKQSILRSLHSLKEKEAKFAEMGI